MAQLTVQAIAQAGLAPAYAAASATGDGFQNTNDETTFLHVKNTNAAACVVTINPTVTSIKAPGAGVLTIAPISVSVPATTGDRMIGPFPQYAFTDPSGNVNATYSVSASVTVAAVRVAPVTR